MPPEKYVVETVKVGGRLPPHRRFVSSYTAVICVAPLSSRPTDGGFVTEFYNLFVAAHIVRHKSTFPKP